MALKEIVARHIPFSDTAANWESYNPIIGKGERIVVESIDKDGNPIFKTVTGDGKTRYTDLKDDSTRILQSEIVQEALGKKLDKTLVDSELAITSENPVQNGVVATRFEAIQKDLDAKADKATMQGMATDANLQAHANNEEVHITEEERKRWDDTIAELQNKVADILYEAIKVTKFSASPSEAEKGSKQNVKLTWEVSKDPAELIVAGNTITPPTKTGSLTISDVTETTTYSMKVTESAYGLKTPATATKTAKITFMDKIYYGAAEMPEVYDSDFVLSLSEQDLTTVKSSGFVLTTGANQYMYYCQPVDMGECSFKVGGFNGGIILDSIIDFTNSTGNRTISYYIYRSANSNLGRQDVEIS